MARIFFGHGIWKNMFAIFVSAMRFRVRLVRFLPIRISVMMRFPPDYGLFIAGSVGALADGTVRAARRLPPACAYP